MLFENSKIKISLWDLTKSAAAIFVCGLLYFHVPTFLNNTANKGYDETTVERIAANMVKVHLAESNKELKALIKVLEQNESKAIEQAKANNEKILEVAKIVGELKGKINTAPEGTLTESGDPDGQRDLYEFMLERDDSKGNTFPTGIVRFSPNVKGEKFSTQMFPLDFNAVIVESESDEGQERYVELWVESNFVKSSKGNKYPIDLKSVQWAKGEEQEKKFRWGPRFGFSSVIDTEDIYPTIDASLFSYGRTKRDMDWRFLGMAIGGTSNDFFLTMYPVSYNIGNFLPLVENIFVAPTISINSDSEQSYGAGVSVPF